MSNIIKFPTNLTAETADDESDFHNQNTDQDMRGPAEEYYQFRQLLVSELVQLRKDVGKA